MAPTYSDTLVEACLNGDIFRVRRILIAGWSSTRSNVGDEPCLLLLASGAGYLELTEVLLAMHANVEDRGIKGDCTPLMEAASAGHVDIVRLLIAHGADVNAQSSSGNTPLMYGCAGGYDDVVRVLLAAGSNIEEHNENGHTPLMEAASAGHVSVSQILLEHGAGINTHSNEFKESALTLACYKGHLSMVRFLLNAGADQEHKTDEMHTALMEASMDGHVEVARLLLDSGAQVNMPTDSFESPLTLAACGGHVDLAMLLIERGANIEEVNDEGYTPLMEAAREGHEEMVALLLSQGATINAQTEETQETALTLACCGGFLEVADFLIKAGADLELGASTPLMEAAQEGHIELVRYLLETNAHVHAQTQTGDTALTYACENGHTDVASMLLQYGADLEHESEGGRTPLMKACRAGHLCTVQFLLSRSANVNRQTSNNDHTPLSLACAGGHLTVVELLLSQSADPFHKLKDNSTMLIEAAKGGHTSVVQLLLDYPHSIMTPPHPNNNQQQHPQQQNQPTTSTTAQLPPVSADSNNTATVAAVEQEKIQVAAAAAQHVANLRGQAFDTSQIVLDETMLAMATVHSQQGQNVVVCNQQQVQQLQHQATQIANTPQQPGGDMTRVEYFAVPSTDNAQQVPSLAVQHATSGLQFQYQQYQLTTGLQVATSGSPNLQFQGTPGVTPSVTPSPVPTDPNTIVTKTAAAASAAGNNTVATPQQIQRMQRFNISAQYQAGFQAGIQQYLESQLGACPATAELNVQQQQQAIQASVVPAGQYVQQSCSTAHQVQVATQTPQPSQQVVVPTTNVPPPEKKSGKSEGGGKSKKRLQTSRQHAAGHHHSSRQQDNVGQQYASGHNQGYNAAQNIVQQQAPQAAFSCMDVDSETDSNHDTALTLACAGGHEELVELLLSRGADIEHRDKKGFTPLILAATAGHEKVVEILLNHNADLEAQSERTKDTPLSLSCSGGRYEVVELLLSRGANKEHRNVSDYTPLSLAASGGYVNIIKLLLTQGAEINSRTGSKLGISPLMLAAMNGHTAAVKMLLDMGSDINAQIETNRNTALTLACFQGRHDVVSLLLDRKANVEHRAKTGLTPLMEAASGGYVDVGRVLLDKGADVNATPVPSSRDTALTIAADKGHCRFVELLLSRGASVEVKNKKGNSPLWLAANGGHLNVVEILYAANADIDSQDNRKVSCLMAAFRKGHIKPVRWMVGHVTQFPSDQEMMRFISTLSDKELLDKCHECVKIIREAKEMQAAKANKNASILLEELDMEKNREESKKIQLAKRRERKKKKKLEKKEQQKRQMDEENQKVEVEFDDNKKLKKKVVVEEEVVEDKDDDEDGSGANTPNESPVRNSGEADKEEGDSGIDANSQGSCSSNEVKAKEKRKEKKKKKNETKAISQDHSHPSTTPSRTATIPVPAATAVSTTSALSTKHHPPNPPVEIQKEQPKKIEPVPEQTKVIPRSTKKGPLIFEASRHPCDREDFEATGTENYPLANIKGKKSYMHYETDLPSTSQKNSTTSPPKQSTKREEGWKEVVRKSSVQTVSTFESGIKKVSVPLNAISRVIGRAGCNINAIRCATGAHIEVEKQSKGQGERNITIKGSAEATRTAHSLIATLIKDPEADILQMIPKNTKSASNFSTWDKTTPATSQTLNKAKTTNLKGTPVVPATSTVVSVAKTSSTIAPVIPSMRSNTSTVKMGTSFPPSGSRTPHTTAPRYIAAAEKRAAAAQMAGIGTKNTMSYTTATLAAGRGSNKVVTSSSANQTFAAKLTETSISPACTIAPSIPQQQQQNPIKAKVSTITKVENITSQQLPPQQPTVIQQSPKHRPQATASAPPTIMPCSNKVPFPNRIEQQQQQQQPEPQPIPMLSQQFLQQQRQPQPQEVDYSIAPVQQPIKNNRSMEYSLFETFPKVQPSMWGRGDEKPVNFGGVSRKFDSDTPQVDASKAPGYRGTTVSSPVSKASTTPPYYPEKQQHTLAVTRPRPQPQASVDLELSYRNIYPGPPLPESNFNKQQSYQEPKMDNQLLHQSFHHQSLQHLGYPPSTSSSNNNVTMSRLNPRAPDFSLLSNKNSQYNPSYHQIPPISIPQQQQYNKGTTSYQPRTAPQPQQQQQVQQQQAQQRWPYMSSFPQPDNMMGGLPNLNPNDYLNLESNSPHMSPNSGNNDRNNSVAHAVAGMDERVQIKSVPRPIGTERAWKNNIYNIVPQQQQQQLQPATINQLGAADINEANLWLLNDASKLNNMNSWSNVAAAAAQNSPMDSRSNMFRPYSSYTHRMPTDDLPNMDQTFSHLESQPSAFPNGTSMSLMHTLQQQYNAVAAAAMAASNNAASQAPPDMDLGLGGSVQGGNQGNTNWDDKNQQHVSVPRLQQPSDILLQRNPHY